MILSVENRFKVQYKPQSKVIPYFSKWKPEKN
jgi:hypothetical protein